MSHEHRHYDIDPYLYLTLILAIVATLPGMYLGLTHTEVSPALGSFLFGMAIFGAAFLLSWAAEVAQIDISESLAVAILALIAVLPEYAVDFVFTWKSAHDPTQAHFAVANMTGANRLLVGLGWPVILFLYVLVSKKKAVVLDESQRVEIFYLAMATLYSFTIPLKGSLNLIDTVILVTLFVLYTRRAAQLESAEPELVGPVKIIANMGTVGRRVTTAVLFLFAGFVIFFVAEPFAESLVDLGKAFGIKEFLLVQWLAPIASESPEFIVAATWTLRGNAGSALKALISSKVNQWTLLIGTIPLVFAISGGAIRPFVLDTLQDHELYLTAAQSLFAVAVLVNLRLTRTEGVLLFILFAAQLVIEQIRMEVAIVYIVLAIVFHIMHRKSLIPAAITGLGLKRRV
ncbi:sodium:proton exchanger [candidate division GN15 bacterium]|uniref:Sodium:proton exchanger n=1 Tax=candidate division GN15 bacterium TaxID=2072418 RepID=A0A855X1W0_9BACT|nr:MAG: sodium:proton exchanger [candidate division GN15 bacterium]